MNVNRQQNANLLFYSACKNVWYSVDAYNNKTCILGVYWAAVVMAKKQRSQNIFSSGGRNK